MAPTPKRAAAMTVSATPPQRNELYSLLAGIKDHRLIPSVRTLAARSFVVVEASHCPAASLSETFQADNGAAVLLCCTVLA